VARRSSSNAIGRFSQSRKQPAEMACIPADAPDQILWWDSKGYDTPYPKLKGQVARAR
jgi:hypothetical protein